MTVDLSSQIDVSTLSSLFEVGVGTNLGMILIDGAKKYLTIYGQAVIRRADDVVQKFLPMLEIEGETANYAVKVVQSWSVLTTTFKNFIAAEAVFWLLKCLCVLVALAFVCLLAASPFLVHKLEYSDVVVLTILSVFPMVLAGLHFVVAALLSAILLLGGWLINWRYRPLIDSYGDLAKRSIFPEKKL